MSTKKKDENKDNPKPLSTKTRLNETQIPVPITQLLDINLTPHERLSIIHEKREWRDIGWGIVWWITVFINVGLAIYYLHNFNKPLITINSDSKNTQTINISSNLQTTQIHMKPDYLAILIGTTVSIIYTMIWMIITSKFPQQIIKISLIALPIITMIVAVFTQSTGIIILIVVVTLFQLFYAYIVWRRVAFASTCLTIAVSVFHEIKTPLFVNITMSVTAMLFIGIDILAFYGFSLLINNQDVYIIFCVFLLFQLWHIKTFINVSHAVACGVIAAWFFGKDLTNVTLNKLGLMLSKSFGSIVFGSFIEAVIRVLQFMLEAARNNARDNNNNFAACVACCLAILVRILGDIIEYINTYVYVHVAVYGKSYIRAAKDTLNLFKSKGITAIINDDLTSYPFIVGAIFGFFIFAAVPFFMNKQSYISIAIVVLIGEVIYFGCVQVIISYVKTMFVCWVEDPALMHSNRPQEFNKLVSAAKKYGYNVDWSVVGIGDNVV